MVVAEEAFRYSSDSREPCESCMTIALEARHLVKQYPGVLAVDNLSFAVREGICFGLLGPNGAGKTTTVEIIEGVTRATSGEVWYYGEPADMGFLRFRCRSPQRREGWPGVSQKVWSTLRPCPPSTFGKAGGPAASCQLLPKFRERWRVGPRCPVFDASSRVSPSRGSSTR